MNYLIYLMICLFIIGVIVAIVYLVKKEEQIAKEKNKKRAEEWDAVVSRKKEQLDNYISKYGPLDKTIQYKCLSKYVIYVFESSSIIIIDDKPVKFENIVSYEVNDNSKILRSSQDLAYTETNTGSLIGRTIVGGLIGGGAGAIIGGLTASKKTTFYHSPEIIDHKYSINIIVNDISNPIISIDLGSDPKNVLEEIVDILSIIIKRNNRLNETTLEP